MKNKLTKKFVIVIVILIVCGLVYSIGAYKVSQKPMSTQTGLNTDTNKVYYTVLTKNNTNGTISIEKDRIITSDSVGVISKAITSSKDPLSDIIKIVGAENIAKSKIQVGEGEDVPGYIIYPAKYEDSIALIITDQSILFMMPAVPKNNEINPINWTINSGITVGTPIASVEKANKNAFEISGLDWDYPAIVSNWKEGLLNKDFSLKFEMTKGDYFDPTDLQNISGDSVKVLSNNESLLKLSPVVSRLYVKWQRI